MLRSSQHKRYSLRWCWKAIAVACLAVAIAEWASADIRESVTLDLYNNVYRVAEGDWDYQATGRGRLDLRATGNRSVRAQLTIDALLSSGPNSNDVTGADMEADMEAADSQSTPEAVFDINRAFVKVRLPFLDDNSFNFTIGKSRLTWGDGMLFNAGDTIFGSAATTPDFTQDTIRDETVWLLAALFPLGQFGFFEPVILPPPLETVLINNGEVEDDAANDPTTPRNDIADTAIGGRVQSQVFGLKGEIGYLYRGENNSHNPSISLQGNLLIDWYLSSSVQIVDAAGQQGSDVWERWIVSIGLLHIVDLPSDASITLRLEGLVRPGGQWQAIDASEEPTTDGRADYGLSLFPEIIWAPSTTVSLYLRSIISPIDLSASITTGIAWSPYQGLSLLLFPSWQVGQKEDRYGITQPGGLALTAGVRYTY